MNRRMKIASLLQFGFYRHPPASEHPAHDRESVYFEIHVTRRFTHARG